MVYFLRPVAIPNIDGVNTGLLQQPPGKVRPPRVFYGNKKDPEGSFLFCGEVNPPRCSRAFFSRREVLLLPQHSSQHLHPPHFELWRAFPNLPEPNEAARLPKHFVPNISDGNFYND